MSRPATLELHRHLEGSIRPVLLRSLAERHGRPDVLRACLAPAGDSYLPAKDFGEFLEMFKAVCAVLVTPADFHAAAKAVAAEMAAEGTVYAELIVSYGGLIRLGRDPRPIQAALAEAADEVRQRHGLVLRWVPDAVRHFGPDAAWRALEAAAAAGRAQGVVGFGLGGDETAAPAADFAPHCADARAEGLGLALHAGEFAGPEAVREAVFVCGADRIGHGLSAPRDPELMTMLAERGTFVELCPGSNVATGALGDPADHPLPAFLAAGIPCALNTDDPAVFGLTLREEYRSAEDLFGLDDARIAAMQRSALAAAFVEEDLRTELADRLADD